MEYLDNKTAWEDVFTTEVDILNKKMPTFDIESLSKSKLRLSLESRILDWKKYEAWIQNTYACASIKETVSEATLRSYSMSSQQAYTLYSHYGFWNQDLIPAFVWENQLIVLGLQYSHHLLKIPNHIFILAPPKVLNYFATLLIKDKSVVNDLDQFNDLFGGTPEGEIADGLQSNMTTISVDFKDFNSETVANITPRPRKSLKSKKTETEVWDLIHDRKDEYIFEAKKQFDAFIILRINFDVTQIAIMDDNLTKQNVNEKLFEYNLNNQNPFKEIFESGESKTLDSAQLGLQQLKFKNISIVALKRSNSVVGYFIGLKNTDTKIEDLNLLEDLAKETVRAS